MKNKTMLGVFAFAIIAMLGVSGLVAAQGGGFGFASDLTDEERAELQEQRQKMQEAIENQDFETWKSLMNERVAKMQAQITEENFNRVVERYQVNSEMRDALQEARESGDFSQLEALKEQYGLEGRGHFRGFRMNLAQ